MHSVLMHLVLSLLLGLRMRRRAGCRPPAGRCGLLARSMLQTPCRCCWQGLAC